MKINFLFGKYQKKNIFHILKISAISLVLRTREITYIFSEGQVLEIHRITLA